MSPRRIYTDAEVLTTLLAKVEPEPNTGCWLWTGAVTGAGYGKLSFRRRLEGAHRVAYELLRGEIAPGLHLDHLCRVPCCVNPDHLEPVTQRENLMRGFRSRGVVEGRCSRGHVKTYLHRNSLRCSECHRENGRTPEAKAKSRARYQSRREQILARQKRLRDARRDGGRTA